MMNRRSMLTCTGLTVGALALGGPAVLFQFGCGSTKQLAKWAGVLIGALKDVSPILTEIGAGNIAALIARAVPIAEKLKQAFEDNDHVSALQFLDNLIKPQTGIIVQIADLVTGLTDERKKIVQGILAIGMVALRLIAAQIEAEVPAPAAASARAARPKETASVQRAADAGRLNAVFQAVKF